MITCCRTRMLCLLSVLSLAAVCYAPPPGNWNGYHWLDRGYAYADTYWDGLNTDYAHREPYHNPPQIGDGTEDCANFRQGRSLDLPGIFSRGESGDSPPRLFCGCRGASRCARGRFTNRPYENRMKIWI